MTEIPQNPSYEANIYHLLKQQMSIFFYNLPHESQYHILQSYISAAFDELSGSLEYHV